MAVQTQIQTRRGTAASWTSTNPTLAAGEIGFESDTGKIKIGTGSTAWNALAYTASSTAVTYLYNATASQTTFSGADANGLTLAYTVGAEQVYLNGVLLVRGTDYTASNGTSVVLTSGAVVSDILNVVAFAAFSVSDDIPKSTLAAKGSIVTASAASTPANLAVGADGSTLVADSSTSTGLRYQGSQAAGRNGIINGGMDIFQRSSYVSRNAYALDRWYINSSANVTVTQSTALTTPNSRFMMLMVASGTQQIFAWQAIESANAQQFAGKTVVLSAYAAGLTTTTNLNMALQWSTTTDNAVTGTWTGITPSSGGNLTLSGTVTRFSGVYAVPSNAKSLRVQFVNNAANITSGQGIYLGDVQLEIGSVATEFSRAGGTIQGELAACQRYYQRYSQTAATTQIIGGGSANNTTTVDVTFPITSAFRVFPTALDTSNVAIYQFSNATKYSSGTFSIIGSGGVPAIRYVHGSGVFTANNVTAFVTDAGSPTVGYVGLSAEL